MTLASLMSRWRTDPDIAESIVEWRTLPHRPARTVPFPEALHPDLGLALRQVGIHTLYTHQAAAWDHARAGRNLVVATGTASGKTLCYNLPVLDRLLQDPNARVLYIFPTKALAQDQRSTIANLLSALPGSRSALEDQPTAIYDGDTPSSARPAIRENAHLVISNPDMLHTGILPHHTAWASFFHGLQFVIIDEMHIYRGVFGSHVANVLRRLKRIASFYGAAPQFILTSATIANPTALAQRLIEAPVELIDNDGSARGQQHFLIYNPPIVDVDLGLRRSLLQESVNLVDDLFTYDVQTILFGRTRRMVELALTYLRDRLPPTLDESGKREHVIRGYRSGYLPHQRREIEQGLKEGAVRTVVATTALELGVDIGGMDAAVLAGYPGTIAATWQQAGRAGRGQADSLAVLIASSSPLDQYLARHPAYFFGRTPEQALINPDNLLILLGHLRCAAFELPFQVGEGFGDLPAEQTQEFLDFLQGEGVLHRSGTKYFWMVDQYPAQGVSLRSASPDRVTLQMAEGDAWRTIGEIDAPSAMWMVHPDAVYLHEAQTYRVQELDLEQGLARLTLWDADYYTEPRRETSVQLINKSAEAEVRGGFKAYGEILVTTQVIGYRKVRWYTHENLGLGELDLPPSQLNTTGYWASLSEATIEELQAQGLWTNAPNNYGPGWPVQRDRARARDKYRCQLCGAPEKGRVHDVHHRVPFRMFVSAEQANRLSNLTTLCPVCHRRAETAVRVRSGLAGLAFALGNLTPLFLMCDARDLGVHADPRASLADGNPTVIIYDQVPAGIGFSENLFNLHSELMSHAWGMVTTCDCADGCPSCVGPGGESGSGGKRETLALLNVLR